VNRRPELNFQSLVKPLVVRRSTAPDDILPNEEQKNLHLFADSIVKPLRSGAPCKLSCLSNLTALTIQFQVRDVLYATDAGLTDNEAASTKVYAVLVLLEQFLHISINLKNIEYGLPDGWRESRSR
jgi:hypothetical protein